MEFLGNYPILERVFLFYKPSLERLGITVSVRAKGRGLQLMFAEFSMGLLSQSRAEMAAHVV